MFIIAQHVYTCYNIFRANNMTKKKTDSEFKTQVERISKGNILFLMRTKMQEQKSLVATINAEMFGR